MFLRAGLAFVCVSLPALAGTREPAPFAEDCLPPMLRVFRQLKLRQEDQHALTPSAMAVEEQVRKLAPIEPEAAPSPKEIARDHKEVIDATIREMSESPSANPLGLQAQKFRMQMEPLLDGHTFNRAILNVLKLRGFMTADQVKNFKEGLRTNIQGRNQEFDDFAFNLMRELDDIIKSKQLPIPAKGVHAATGANAKDVYLEYWREELRNHLGELKAGLLAYLTEEGMPDVFRLAETKIAQEQRGRQPHEFERSYAMRRGQRHYLSSPISSDPKKWRSAKQLAQETDVNPDAVRSYLASFTTAYAHGAIVNGHLREALLQMNALELEVIATKVPESLQAFTKQRIEYLKSLR